MSAKKTVQSLTKEQSEILQCINTNSSNIKTTEDGHIGFLFGENHILRNLPNNENNGHDTLWLKSQIDEICSLMIESENNEVFSLVIKMDYDKEASSYYLEIDKRGLPYFQ